MPRVAPVWVPMDDVDRLCISALATCSFQAGHSDKRVARELDERRSTGKQISLGQRSMLYALVWKYRRQISTKPLVKAVLYLAEAQARWQLAQDEARTLPSRRVAVDVPALFA